MTLATSEEAGAQAALHGAPMTPIPAPRKTRAAPPRPIPAAGGAETGERFFVFPL